MDGGCACGSLRYRLSARPLFVHCCHCTACQRETGSAFAVNILIEAGAMDVTGETVSATPPTESGTEHREHRCPSCGVAVWSTYGGRPQIRFVRVGTLDRPADAPPDVHIFTRSKQPWVRLPEGALAFEAYYDTRAHWPAESLARRKAAFS